MRPYYLLYGEESYLVERALAALRGRLLPGERTGSWRVLWGDEGAGRLDEALGSLVTPSLFGGTQVLVVRRAEALRDEEQERLLAILPTLGAGGCLILVSHLGDRRRRLVVACVEARAAYHFPAVADARAAEPWVVRLAEERGHAIAPAAAQELIDRTGTDLGSLASELEKLALHVGTGGRIGVDDVRALVSTVRAQAVGDLTDRLGQGDVGGALRTLRRLLADGEAPIRLVAFMAANFRRALHVSELTAAGNTVDQIAARLGMPPWLVRRVGGHASASGVARRLAVLGRLDQQLKQGRPTEAAFEAALLGIAESSRRADD